MCHMLLEQLVNLQPLLELRIGLLFCSSPFWQALPTHAHGWPSWDDRVTGSRRTLLRTSQTMFASMWTLWRPGLPGLLSCCQLWLSGSPRVEGVWIPERGSILSSRVF